MGEQLSFCERVTAGPETPWHIRVVGPEGLKPSGGAPDTTLCGRSLQRGWDLRLAVTINAARGVKACAACTTELEARRGE